MILVVDHYDSFTFNLVQLIESLGRETRVVRSDERPTAELRHVGKQRLILGARQALGVTRRIAEPLEDELDALLDLRVGPALPRRDHISSF